MKGEKVMDTPALSTKELLITWSVEMGMLASSVGTLVTVAAPGQAFCLNTENNSFTELREFIVAGCQYRGITLPQRDSDGVTRGRWLREHCAECMSPEWKERHARILIRLLNDRCLPPDEAEHAARWVKTVLPDTLVMDAQVSDIKRLVSWEGVKEPPFKAILSDESVEVAKPVKYDHFMLCPDCRGSGEYKGFNTIEPCRTCGGKGMA